MDVSAAVNKRSSIRQFRPDSISDDMLRGLLADASRAPSGGNLQ
ncbi:MAG: nitroreductase, partial [Actinobacteria bacterium]|nr:nitroreductase [Actinomycetota bacterium]